VKHSGDKNESIGIKLMNILWLLYLYKIIKSNGRIFSSIWK
jgi:hypothetical protein